jgi:hypothetical protein
MSVRSKRAGLRIALIALLATALVASLLQLGWTGYATAACLITFYVCFNAYADMPCPACRRRILELGGFFPPKNFNEDLKRCPHCDADFDTP